MNTGIAERSAARRVSARVDALWRDARYALRTMAARPTVPILSVLCLALGIGANTTVFTFVNALLLRPAPLTETARLMLVQDVSRQDPGSAGPLSFPNFIDVKTQGADVAEMAGQRSVSVRIAGEEGTRRYAGALVTANFFSMLGVRPAAGRIFSADEDRPGGPPVVVLSHAVWRERYGADPALLGRAITVNGAARTVVGIMRPELASVAFQRIFRGAQVWLPVGSAEPGGRDDRRLIVFAKLARGTTAERATARLDAVARALETTHPIENSGRTISVRPLRVGFSARTRGLMLLMMGAVGFVLLIACANVANLTLARATSRRLEIATRLALGAPFSRIVSQLLTESVLIAFASVPGGIAIAYWGRGLLAGSNATPDQLADIAIDRYVLLFTIGLAIVTSILSGLLPALHAVRRVRGDLLRTGPGGVVTGPSHHRLSRLLIVGEVALALMLLVGASLFVQSFANLLSAEGGFDTSRILTVSVETDENDRDPSDASVHRVRGLVERLRALPGVTRSAAANLMPLRDAGVRGAVVPDHAYGQPDWTATVALGGVTPGFFAVLNVGIVSGRMFTDAEERGGAAVAVVNRTMAERLWPESDAVGRRFVWPLTTGDRWFSVVGVSEDILTWDLSNRPVPTAYVPYAFVPAREPALFLRTSGDPALIARPARAALVAAEPALPILHVSTMTEVHYAALSRNRTLAALFVVLGAVALLLGATGVYGVVSYFVSQRTREMGIRAALGADRRALVRLVVRQGLSTTIVGVFVGLGGAVALARLVRAQLHEVSATDPWSFAGVAVLLLLVSLAATYLPARRAAAADPLAAIREA